MDEIKANTLDSYLIVIFTLPHCYYFWCNSLQLGFHSEIATIYWPPSLKTLYRSWIYSNAARDADIDKAVRKLGVKKPRSRINIILSIL